jgi:DmsE family decaheme c-type cytochrome
MIPIRRSLQAGLAAIACGLVLAFLIALPATAARRTSADKPARVPAAAAMVQDESAYAGEDTCVVCHEDRHYKGTPHALVSNPRTPAAGRGCESCHGPGKAHAESGGDTTKIVRPSKLKPQESSVYCTACHDRGTHALWSGSQHDQRNVGCVTCHSVHAPKGEKLLKASTQAAVCATCHQNIVNKLNRFDHMPVREGKIECSSCHNPHGSTNIRLLKAGTTVDESCTSCHSEKRGPYLWEHAPVANACITCHDPHGTNNDRMLQAKVPFLCQRCHVTSRHPPTVYEGFLLNNSTNGNKITGRGCVVCHQQIHGSNAPSGKAFLR